MIAREHFLVSHHGYADIPSCCIDFYNGSSNCDFCLNLLDEIDETIRISEEFRLFCGLSV